MVETSTGEALISTRPFAVTKWSAWLVSKDSPVSQSPSPVILKSATISYCTPCRRPLTGSTRKKTLRLQKPSVPNIVGRRNRRAGMSAYCQGGSATGGQRAATSPWKLQYVVCGALVLPYVSQCVHAGVYVYCCPLEIQQTEKRVNSRTNCLIKAVNCLTRTTLSTQ